MSKCKYSETKLRVLNEEHSAAFQEEMLSLGIGWSVAGDVVCYTDKKFLYVNDYGELSYGEDEALFNSNDFREISFNNQEGDVCR